MKNKNLTPLILAFRLFADRDRKTRTKQSGKPWKVPRAMFAFDTETRTDAAQKLTFGGYRFYLDGVCLEEGLFYADDLPTADRKILEDYVSAHAADTVQQTPLKLLTREEFLNRLFGAAYKGRCLLSGFNLPFDFARIASDFTKARKQFTGGFSLILWDFNDEQGVKHPDHFRPRVAIKQIDSKRALKGFTSRLKPDQTDQIPEDSITGEPDEKYIFRGHFLDARTLAFALTDRGHTLAGACEAFRVENGKQSVSEHGVVTKEYIDYNRRDVQATAELTMKVLDDYALHPISLQATKVYSPASIGKSYLQAMGIPPILERQPDFPRRYLGHAAACFYGGRTSAHIRRASVPVIYTDFLSMYPTVNSLMNLWSFVVAERIDVVENCKDEIEEFLNGITADALFRPDTWKRLPAFVKIVPDGDILPTRANYNRQTNDWQVAVNHLYSPDSDSEHSALWFTLPDVVASVLPTGKVPRIVDAFRIVPSGTLSDPSAGKAT